MNDQLSDSKLSQLLLDNANSLATQPRLYPHCPGAAGRAAPGAQLGMVMGSTRVSLRRSLPNWVLACSVPCVTTGFSLGSNRLSLDAWFCAMF